MHLLLRLLLFSLPFILDTREFHTMWKSVLFRCGALFGTARAPSCSAPAIQSLLPPGSSVNFAYPLKAGDTFKVPAGDLGYPRNPVGLPALCAVSVQVQSISNSSYGLGLFLPEDWNGRFLAVGNGGFAGGINWWDMVRKYQLIPSYMYPLTKIGSWHPLRVCNNVDGYWTQFFIRRWLLGIPEPCKY